MDKIYNKVIKLQKVQIAFDYRESGFVIYKQ